MKKLITHEDMFELFRGFFCSVELSACFLQLLEERNGNAVLKEEDVKNKI